LFTIGDNSFGELETGGVSVLVRDVDGVMDLENDTEGVSDLDGEIEAVSEGVRLTVAVIEPELDTLGTCEDV